MLELCTRYSADNKASSDRTRESVASSTNVKFSIFFTIFLHISICGSNELSLEIVDVSIIVKKVFLLIPLDLNAPEALLREVLGIIHINNVLIIIVTLLLVQFLLCFLLESEELALVQAVKVDWLRVFHL